MDKVAPSSRDSVAGHVDADVNPFVSNVSSLGHCVSHNALGHCVSHNARGALYGTFSFPKLPEQSQPLCKLERVCICSVP